MICFSSVNAKFGSLVVEAGLFERALKLDGVQVAQSRSIEFFSNHAFAGGCLW